MAQSPGTTGVAFVQALAQPFWCNKLRTQKAAQKQGQLRELCCMVPQSVRHAKSFADRIECSLLFHR